MAGVLLAFTIPARTYIDRDRFLNRCRRVLDRFEAGSPVRILGNVSAAARHPVSLGVALGLFLGKPIGIWLFARLSVGILLATPPEEVSCGKIIGATWLCGIGFTMSLFIATIAFGEGALLDMSRIDTLASSVGAGLCGSFFLLRRGKADAPLAAHSALPT